MRQRYPLDSAVWCTWEGGKEYSARVIDYDERAGEFRYKVHFTGWNSRYDDWVAESQLRMNKNPIVETPGQGRYSPEPECSKRKNGKKRKEEDRPSEQKRDKKEKKEPVVVKEKSEQKAVKRKIEILSDIPSSPSKRSKSVRMKYSPPPKTVATPSVRGRGRPPKSSSNTTANTPVIEAVPSTSGADKFPVIYQIGTRNRSRQERHEEENNESPTRVLSPSTVRRRKRAAAGCNEELEIDETRDGYRTPVDTHPPDMGSPTSAVLSLAIDLYLEYGGRLKSPDGRTMKIFHPANKKEVIAGMVEKFKHDERRLRFRRYLQMKKELVKDFEKYLSPLSTNSNTLSAAPSGYDATANIGGDENQRIKEEVNEDMKDMKEVKMEVEEEGEREEDRAANGLLDEEIKEEEMEVKEEEGKVEGTTEGSPTEGTTASPTDTAPKPTGPTATSSTMEIVPKEEEQQSNAPVSSPPVNAIPSSKTSPLTVTTSTSGMASGGVTPSPSPVLPPNLKPNPNVPQEQSYDHIPFVGAETGRDVVTQMRAQKAQQMRGNGAYFQIVQGRAPPKGYTMSSSSNRSMAVSRGGRHNLFAAPSIPSYSGNGKSSLMMQPKKMMHDSLPQYSYYDGPSTSSGGGMNGGMKQRDWYNQRDSIEYVNDFSQGVVAEEVVVSDEMEIDGNEPGPSSRIHPQQLGATEVRADHCYGATTAAKARLREQHLASRDYAPSVAGGVTMSASNHMRHRLVVPRQYNTMVKTGGQLITTGGTRPVSYLASSSSGSSGSNPPTFKGNNVFVGTRPVQGTINNGMIRFRPAAAVPPILHTGVGGAGNVRVVDSRRLRQVYVRTTSNGMSTATAQSFVPTRVTSAGSGMNGGGNGTVAGGTKRVFISPPTRLVVPKVTGGTGGVTMAAARGTESPAVAAAAAAATAANSQPPVLVPETQSTGDKQ